jgi:hypothetical protein
MCNKDDAKEDCEIDLSVELFEQILIGWSEMKSF